MKHVGEVLVYDGKRRVINCTRCSYAHLDPLPSAEELDKFYRKQFYSEVKPSYFAEEIEDLNWWRLWFSIEFRLLQRTKLTRGECVLDVGCGQGLFLEFMRTKGWDVAGNEPSALAEKILHKKKIPNYAGSLESADIPLNRWDAVRMAWVLEHTLSPRVALNKVHRMLKNGGVVSVTVPNDFNSLQKTLCLEDDRKKWWVNEQHLNYFTPNSLHGLLQSCGFTPMVSYASFPIEIFLFAKKDYIGKPEVGRAVHSLRKATELAIAETAEGRSALERFSRALAMAGLGRDLTIIARKS